MQKLTFHQSCGSVAEFKFQGSRRAGGFYTLFDPDRSAKTRLQVKVTPDTTATGITDSRYLCKQIRATQRAITRLCIQCGLFLLQHGAESALVEELSTRLGLALGMDSVESAISSNAIVLTTIKDGECLTSTRKNTDRGINMHVVTEVQHIVIMAEHKLLDYKDVEKRFAQIKPLRYPRWLLVFMVGLSCACFCKLNNGGWDGALVTFCASTVAMYIRRTHPSFNASANQLLPHRLRRNDYLRADAAPAGFRQHADDRDGRQRATAGTRFSADQRRCRHV